jgi:chromosome segregation ATPase
MTNRTLRERTRALEGQEADLLSRIRGLESELEEVQMQLLFAKNELRDQEAAEAEEAARREKEEAERRESAEWARSKFKGYPRNL